MNFHSARVLELFAQAMACMARIEAMKTANAARERRGEVQAYIEDAFMAEANSIESCANSIHAYSENCQ
jgi:hypothetical protein